MHVFPVCFHTFWLLYRGWIGLEPQNACFPVYFHTFWFFYRGWMSRSGSNPARIRHRPKKQAWSISMHAFPSYFHTFWPLYKGWIGLEHQNARFSYVFSCIPAPLYKVDLKPRFKSGPIRNRSCSDPRDRLSASECMLFLCIFIHSGLFIEGGSA